MFGMIYRSEPFLSPSKLWVFLLLEDESFSWIFSQPAFFCFIFLTKDFSIKPNIILTRNYNHLYMKNMSTHQNLFPFDFHSPATVENVSLLLLSIFKFSIPRRHPHLNRCQTAPLRTYQPTFGIEGRNWTSS